MIIGIDETGDFKINGNEYCYFVGVHLDQNKDKLIRKQLLFETWENSIPETFKAKSGEIKASRLPEKYLESFYFDVLEPEPRSTYCVVKVLPLNNPESLQIRHQRRESEEFERTYKRLEQEGNFSKSQIYKNIFLWHRRLAYDKFIKLRCMYSVLGLSFNWVILGSQLYFLVDKFDDSNLKNIQFKIDKDFIATSHSRKVWNELFRHFWFDFTKQFKVPIIAYPDGVQNPIEKHFRIQNGRVHIPETFGGNTNFLDSNRHFEIRIADVIAYIFHRFENKRKCQSIGRKLLEKFADIKSQYHELVLEKI